MLDSVDFGGRPFHFIGIGGIGMSALAYILTKRNLPVSGSDLRLNHITQRLQSLGAHIFWSQEATNLEFFQQNNKVFESTIPSSSAFGVTTQNSSAAGSSKTTTSSTLEPIASQQMPQVIVSTAVNLANSEYQAALSLNCPIFHRADLLAALMQCYQSIGVAGTHGKTTTSSLIGYMLLQSGLDPTIIVGGEVQAWEGNARLGEGDYLVAEADESDGSLVKLSAKIGVITNIELDHPDHYGSLDEVVQTFKTFAGQCQTLVGSIDCPTVRECLQPTITYSLHPESGADYTVDSVTYGGDGTIARVWERGTVLGEVHLKLLGRHNLSNALAAIAVGRQLGLEFSTIARAIATFQGARRRFEHRGEHSGILFVDDYAHHPSEIQVTLAAARLHVQNHSQSIGASQRRVVAIFQPHRYSRTLTFLSEFAQSFNDADLVVLTDIYSAGEPDLGQVSGQQVADLIGQYHPQVTYQASLKGVTQYLKEILRPGDLALFLGAGNLNQVIPDLMTTWQIEESRQELSEHKSEVRELLSSLGDNSEINIKNRSFKADSVISQEWCNQA